MKEKINEYLDNRVKKEEVEELLLDKEYAFYYEDLKKMKEGLRELRVNPPDFVSKLRIVERKQIVFRYSFAFVMVLVLVFGVWFSMKFALYKELASKQTEITKQFKASPGMGIMQISTEETIKVEISKSDLNNLINSLQKIATLKSKDEKNGTYVFEVQGKNISEFLNSIENFHSAKILENSLKDKAIDTNLTYQVTLTILIK
ncbi:hypothetical protein [Caldisericum exile]|uniref:hypothetical protein n=1 Tax=Caldisericum exile TaxID=693075 RepID=UPI003C708B39